MDAKQEASSQAITDTIKKILAEKEVSSEKKGTGGSAGIKRRS
jgi:hypothetical protein